MKNNRYVVKCMFRISRYEMGGRELPGCHWVERIFYIEAPDTEASYRLAEELCYEYECDYTDREGAFVCCRLHEITDSYELPDEELKDKTELYHNFFDATDEELEWILHRQYGEKDPEPHI